MHYPLEVDRRHYDLYASQGAGKDRCKWELQNNNTAGFPSGFDCGPSPGLPGLQPGLDCNCNRLIVKAQVTALSEAVGNISGALKAKGMYDNSVLVFMGDNGGKSMGFRRRMTRPSHPRPPHRPY